MTEKELKLALEKVGRMNLGALPTPIMEMPNVAKYLGVNNCYIKRDDLTGLGPGGNKVRNLDYILYNAVQNGADTIIVSGPAQSNLCSITACACAKLGLACVLVLNGPENPVRTGNLLLDQLCGAEIVYLPGTTKYERNDHMKIVKAELEAQGKHPYIIENGASTGYGALGYMEALLEIKAQDDAMGGKITSIFVPAGNGGVVAGVAFANDLIGRPYQVVAVSAEFDHDKLVSEMRRIIGEAEEILGIPFTSGMEDACTITDKYYGGGWGINTPESEQAVYDFARMEGFFLENAYSSKNFVGYCDCIKNGIVPADGALFLHTGGFASLFAQYLDK